MLERWEGISDDLQDTTIITEDQGNSKIGFLENLMLEDDLKESSRITKTTITVRENNTIDLSKIKSPETPE